MADIKLFNINGKVKEYQSGTVTLEKELQTVIENNLPKTVIKNRPQYIEACFLLTNKLDYLFSRTAACAAASLAIGTLKGEQDT